MHVLLSAASFTVRQDDPVPEGEVLLSVENKSPIQDSFQFQRVTGGLTRWVFGLATADAQHLV